MLKKTGNIFSGRSGFYLIQKHGFNFYPTKWQVYSSRFISSNKKARTIEFLFLHNFRTKHEAMSFIEARERTHLESEGNLRNEVLAGLLSEDEFQDRTGKTY